MPKASVIQSDFGSGEISPLFYGQVASPRYKSGLETCVNYLPALQGPLYRRPGTKYLTNVKDSGNPPKLVPFQFSITQAYMLEFGDKYIRFYDNNGQILTTGTTYQIQGSGAPASMSNHQFWATRPSLVPQLNESITTQSSVSSSVILELVTPYSIADIPKLRFTQSADILYITHPNYPTAKLQRFGNTYWTLKYVYFQDGPYLALNSYAQTGDSTPIGLIYVKTGSTFFLETVVSGQTSPPAISGAASASGLIRITATAHGLISGQLVYITGVVGTTEANNTGFNTWSINVITANTFDLIGSTFVNAYISGGIVNPALFTATDAPTSLFVTGRAAAIVVSGVRYWGYITFAGNPAKVQWQLDVSNTVATGSTITAWQLGVYCNTNGYPSISCLHQSRLVLGAPTSYPQEIDGSVTGSFEIFSPSNALTLTVQDNNAFQFLLASQDVNSLRWLVSNSLALLSGSYTAEWMVAASTQGAALSPTSVNAQQTSAFGSADAQAIPVGNAAIYIQRANRKVREMNYFWQAGTFRSTDLSAVSEHITIPSITKIVNQKETQPVIWGIRSDGILLAMVYDRDDLNLKAGWARCILGGQSDAAGTPPVVYDIGVIPDPTIAFDQLWLIVKRYINGSTVYTIEYMSNIFNDSVAQEDAYLLDCGSTFDNPKVISGISIASPCVITATAHGFSNGDSVKITDVVGLNISSTDINGNVTITNLINEKTFVVASAATNTFALHDFSGNAVSSVGYSIWVSGGNVRKLVSTITGLTWLENETVSILADGAIEADVVVSNSGSISLPYPAAKVQIGYKYLSQGKTLRTEAGAADGSSIGKTRRISRVAFMIHKCGEFSYGTSFTNMYPLQFGQADQRQADQPVPLFSGIKREGIDSPYDFEGQVCFQQSSALPGIVNSITIMEEEFDV